MFSRTTVASSTKIPIIRDMANNVIKLSVYPNNHITAKEVINEVGIAIRTIIEFRKLRKNSNITSETSITANSKSNTTESTAAMVLSVLSSAIANFKPANLY